MGCGASRGGGGATAGPGSSDAAGGSSAAARRALSRLASRRPRALARHELHALLRAEDGALTRALWRMLGKRCAARGEDDTLPLGAALAALAALLEGALPAAGSARAWELGKQRGRVEGFAYALYDPAGEGVVTAAALAGVVAQALGGGPAHVARTLQAADPALWADGDGACAAVGPARFAALCRKVPKLLYPAFALFDKAATVVRAARALPELADELEEALPRADGGPGVPTPARLRGERIADTMASVQAFVAAKGAAGSACGHDGANTRAGVPQQLHGRFNARKSQSHGAGASVVLPSPRGMPQGAAGLAHRAARLGRAADVAESISSGKVHVDARNHADQTLLAVAAANGHKAVCRKLIALGADLDARDARGNTPAAAAAAYNHVELCSWLERKRVYLSGLADVDGRELAHSRSLPHAHMHAPADPQPHHAPAHRASFSSGNAFMHATAPPSGHVFNTYDVYAHVAPGGVNTEAPPQMMATAQQSVQLRAASSKRFAPMETMAPPGAAMVPPPEAAASPQHEAPLSTIMMGASGPEASRASQAQHQQQGMEMFAAAHAQARSPEQAHDVPQKAGPPLQPHATQPLQPPVLAAESDPVADSDAAGDSDGDSDEDEAPDVTDLLMLSSRHLQKCVPVLAPMPPVLGNALQNAVPPSPRAPRVDDAEQAQPNELPKALQTQPVAPQTSKPAARQALRAMFANSGK